MPIVGLVLFALGLVAATIEELLRPGQTALLVGGILALEVGLVMASGWLVTLAGRLAPFAGVSGRLALRDTARQRTRTAPAVAAIIAAMAGVVAGATFVASSNAHTVAQYEPLGAVGTVAVGMTVNSPVGIESEVTPERYDAAVAAVRAGLPIADIVPVNIAQPEAAADGSDANASTTDAPASAPGLSLVRPEANTCGGPTSNGAIPTPRNDPRCSAGISGQVVWSSPSDFSSIIVDDGPAIGALGVPTAGEAADALAGGRVVVSSPLDLAPDGTVKLRISSWDPTSNQETVLRELDVPAAAVHLGDPVQYGLVLPPAVAKALGMRTELAGFVATTTRMPTEHEKNATNSALHKVAPAAYLTVERGPQDNQGLVVWILVGAALVVGLGATGISVALASAESRPDMATLAAVGAAPSVRRRISAARAGVLCGIGVTLGVVTGLMLGRVLVLAQKYGFEFVDRDWHIVTPWLPIATILIGVPLVSMGGAYLFTRSRLPMGRRVTA